MFENYGLEIWVSSSTKKVETSGPITIGTYGAHCSLDKPHELSLRESIEHMITELWFRGFVAGDHPE